MAEEKKNGAAQEEMGELFVNIGATGLGGLIKGLNAASASFLLTKNAATQMLEPIKKMSKEGAATATTWDKISAISGFKLTDIQDIQNFSKLNNIDFSSFIGQLTDIQQKLVKLRMTGKAEGLEGFAMLGLNPRDFDYKNPMQMLEAVKNKVQKLDDVTAAGALRLLGLNEDLLYIFKQQNKGYSEKLRLNNKEIDNLKEQQTAWNNLANAWETGQRKFVANQNWVNKSLNEMSKIITDLFSQHFDWEYGQEQSGFFKMLAKMGQGIADIKINILGKQNIDIPGQLLEAYNKGDKEVFKRYEEALRKNGQLLEAEKIKWLQIKDTIKETQELLNGKEQNKDLSNFPLVTDLINSDIVKGHNLPSINDIKNTMPSSNSQTINVSINQEITGENAPAIAQEVARVTKNELNTIYLQNPQNV